MARILKVECDTCGQAWLPRDLERGADFIEKAVQLLGPGARIPYGLCPSCQGFAYAQVPHNCPLRGVLTSLMLDLKDVPIAYRFWTRRGDERLAHWIDTPTFESAMISREQRRREGAWVGPIYGLLRDSSGESGWQRGSLDPGILYASDEPIGHIPGAIGCLKSLRLSLASLQGRLADHAAATELGQLMVQIDQLLEPYLRP